MALQRREIELAPIKNASPIRILAHRGIVDSPIAIDDIPQLPSPERPMDWRDLNRFKADNRSSDFYATCLEYAQCLWRQRLPARAILCLDRAWGADLQGSEPILKTWPLPYQALVDILRKAPEECFLGNPRVHFQHYADRLGPPREPQRRWRSWACWALSCLALPDFPGDPKHQVELPSLETIERQLENHGHPGEAALWQTVLRQIQPRRNNLPQY